jgi:1,5-anhydro-D-fructose reductase (1,5-anhydro-D-mannitol-forming)
MKTIRWGMIGCGDVAEVKSGPGFQHADGSELVAVMRRRGDLAADFARRHGVRASYDDAAALINDPAVDAVYVATPPGAHEELALAVCAARKPAYVEKPMARTHAECQRMIDAFAAAGVPLFVAYYRRALPRFLRARDLVASGALGRVTGVSYRLAGPYHRDTEALVREGAPLPWRLQAEQAGGGLFLDLGCHTLDMLDFILGPLEDVQGSASNVATGHLAQNPQRVPNLPRSAPAGDPPMPDAILVEDSVAMTFRTAGGALGAAQWTFASDERADEIVISGDRGELRLSTFGNEPVAVRRGGEVESFDLPNPRHVQQPMIQTVVDHLLGRGQCQSMGVSAARTSAVIDVVLRGYYGTRADGFWRFPESWPGGRAKATRPPG